jgi:hypothetical protein
MVKAYPLMKMTTESQMVCKACKVLLALRGPSVQKALRVQKVLRVPRALLVLLVLPVPPVDLAISARLSLMGATDSI